MFTRGFVFAWLGAALLPGCYASSGDVDVDAGGDATGTDARVDAGSQPRVSLQRSTPSDDSCRAWDVLVHPSPTVPAGTPDGVQPLWQHRDPLDGYVGDIGVALDGSIRVLGPRATTFLRINRDGTEAWSRDVGAQAYVWSIAPDGSIFAVSSEDGDYGHRVVHLAPDGTIVGAYDFDASGPGIESISFGAGGRVYVSNGSLVALCRTDHVDWEMTASMASGGVALMSAPVVDSVGAVLVSVTGTTRVARISEEGILLEWIGDDRPEGPRPEAALGKVTSLFQTRAIVYSMVDGTWMDETTIAAPGEPPVNRLHADQFDGLGRIISSDGLRGGGWLWEQGDGSVVHTGPLCGFYNVLALADGGVLCVDSQLAGNVLRRVSPEGRVVWEHLVPERASNLVLDVDGRLTFAAATDGGLHSEVRSVQTNLRPAPGHWGYLEANRRSAR